MKIVIAGAGEVGSHLAKLLRAEGHFITVIDDDMSRLERVSSYADIETVNGNPASLDVQKKAVDTDTDLFIAVYPYCPQETNLVTAMIARKLGARKSLARVNEESTLSAESKLIFKELGIEQMFCPEQMAADEISRALKHNATIDDLSFAGGKMSIIVFRIDDDSPVIDCSIGELGKSCSNAEGEHFRVIAISRNGRTLIPDAQTVFYFSDIVYAVCEKNWQSRVIRLFGKELRKIERLMILGGSRIAALVAKKICNEVQSIKIIEKDRERCIQLSESLAYCNNVQIVGGDGTDSDFLYDEGIKDCDAFISLTESDETNLLSSVVAKKFGVQKTVAEVENIEYIHLAEEMGVDTIINKKLITAGRVFKFTLSDTAKVVKYMSGSNAEIIEYTAAPGSRVTKGALKDISFPKEAKVGGIIRGKETFIAIGDTRIEAYDRVAVFALPQTVKEIDAFFR